jgi:hypothetical protein
MLLYSIDMDSRDQGITVHFHVVSEIFCWITGHSGACLFSILDEKGRKKLIEIALNTLTLRNNNNNLTFKCVNIHFFIKRRKILLETVYLREIRITQARTSGKGGNTNIKSASHVI